MNILTTLNDAMDYIEKNLAGEIDFDKLARIACCSEYHFRRMFSYLTGIPLGEYIRRRRLSYAMTALQTSDVKILDLALSLGYESGEAFGRAFLSVYGTTPSGARKDKPPRKAFGPFTFQLSIKGGEVTMDYRIVEKSAFKIIGVSGRIPLVYYGPNPHFADVWRKLRQEDLLTLVGFSETEPRGIMNVYANYEDRTAEGTHFDLYVGIATEKKAPERWSNRFVTLEVPSSLWVVFTSVGKHPDAEQAVWGRIFSEWFPESGYEHSGGPEMTWCESYDFTNPDFKSEIWIPIKRRAIT